MPTQKQFLDNTGLTQLLNDLGQYLKNKLDTLTFDNSPTTNSTNPVTSGGVKTALDEKQDKDFIIGITNVNNNYVSNKTFAEILSAYGESRTIIVQFQGAIYNLSYYEEDDYFYFTHPEGFGNYDFLIYSNNSVLFEVSNLQPSLVSGTNIKTVNNTSLLGSGNIAVQPSKFIITATQQGANTNFNKTYAEILAAYNTGADVVLHEVSTNDTYKLASYNEDDEIITFLCFSSLSTLCQWSVDSTDTWDYNDFEFQRRLSNQVTLKSINNTSLLGSGNVEVQPTLVSGTNIKTVNNNSLLGSGNVNLNDAAISYDGNAANVLEDATNVQEALDLLDEAVSDKQDALVSGTNIKTINNTSLLSSGNIDLTKKVEYFTKADMDADISQPNGTIGYDGDNEVWYIFDQPNSEWRRMDGGEPNEIVSITTSESSASGGNNTVTITETNGTSHTFNVKNGVDGQNGVSLGEVAIADDQTTDDATKVLSARLGKLIGDDVSRLKDYEFGVKTYDEDDLVKNKSYSNNSSVVNARMTVLANYGCIKIPVTKGDKLTIATAGASGARAYSLCDEELATYLVASSGKDTTSNPDTISVTKDGYCHINCKSTAYANFSVTHYYSLERQMLADNTRSLTQGEMNGTSDWIKDKLEELGWEYDQYVKSNGTTVSQSNYCASPFIPVSGIKGHSITFCYMFNAWGTGCVAFYNSSNSFISGLYYTCNANNTRTVDIGTGSSWDNAAYLRMTCNPNKLNECYILDNTTGEYIWKGSDYLGTIYENNLVSYATFRDVLLTQESGDKTNIAMSQKAVGEAIEAAPLRKMKYNNYAVFGAYDEKNCISVDTYNIDELKVITSLRICDTFGAGSPSYYNYNLHHILGIVNATSPDSDYLSLYGDGYNLYLRLRKSNSNVLNYSLGVSNGRKIIRTFARFDLYGKTVSLFTKASDGTYLTVLENYDISELDLSNLQNVKIVTSIGCSHKDYMLFNHVQINNYIVSPTEQLDTTVGYGEYSTKTSRALLTKPSTPSTYKFTNENNTTGITVTLNDPLHKIITVDRDTAALVYEWGFYSMGNVPTKYRTYSYEICKIKFTNVTSNLLMRGWSENGGSNYILDPTTYVYTKIPMDTTTGTVLEYPIEEGKTYYLIYALGSGYSTRNNHYIGGHFTMEITEPTIYCIGSMNLCAEYYDGDYFCGRIPFKTSASLTPTVFGQFTDNYDFPKMKGRLRLKSGNVQIYNGSVWKQINNS